MEGGRPLQVYFDDDEDPNTPDSTHMVNVRSILTQVFGSFEATTHGGTDTVEFRVLPIEAGMTAKYFRALVKVAFHYVLWSCNVLRGDDPVYAEVREFVSNGTGDWRRFVQPVAPNFFGELVAGRLPSRTGHFFLADITRERATCQLQFFVGPHGAPPPSLVTLALNPLLVHARQLACHGALYFAEEGEPGGGSHDGELVEFDILERRIVLPGTGGSGSETTRAQDGINRGEPREWPSPEPQKT